MFNIHILKLKGSRLVSETLFPREFRLDLALKKLLTEVNLILLIEVSLARGTRLHVRVCRHILGRVGARWVYKDITALLRTTFGRMPCRAMRCSHLFSLI